MRRRALLLLGALAACSAPGVTSESARQQPSAVTDPPVATPAPEPPPTTDPSPPTEPTPPEDSDPEPTEPEPTEPAGTAPEETDAPPPTDADTGTTDPAGGLESIGDSLFPEVGTDDLDVQSYDVRLDYDPATRVIDGAVTLRTVVLAAPERLVLDAVNVAVEEVTVDGVAAEFELADNELVITPAAPAPTGTPVAIDISYTDEAQRSGAFDGLASLGFFGTTDGSYVLNQPDGARTWLPSNDHPADKALWHFEITVPTGTTAVANGELVEQRTGPDTTTWVWDQRQPMATYLVQVLTGDYEILDRPPAGTVPITDVALAGDVERMAPYFDLTDDQLAFYEPLFGPYPLDRYGLAFSDSPPGLAMEQQGRSLYSRGDFPGGAPGFIQHLLTAHELAHMWFGDAVSPADWGDLWLNESMATYAQWLWLDHVGMAPLETQAAANLSLRQSFAEPTGEPTVDNLFGFERYDGGAVVVHALRREIGDDAFFQLLKDWVTTYQGSSASTADFIALASEVAGRDLTTFFDTWLFAADIPDDYPG